MCFKAAVGQGALFSLLLCLCSFHHFNTIVLGRRGTKILNSSYISLIFPLHLHKIAN